MINIYIFPIVEFQHFHREQRASWLRDIGQSATRSLEELRSRIQTLSLYLKLVNRLKTNTKKNYKFQCSLDTVDIPQTTPKWTSNEVNYPIVNKDIFLQYCSFKKQGNSGQQEKAFRMLQCGKIVSVKTFHGTEGIDVQAMIKKSYGTDTRPAIVLFKGLMPEKGRCTCLVRTCIFCCHILALLLFQKHYREEKPLQLTCTEQLQKWHHRTTKSSIPMIPLKDIKPKSAKMKNKAGK